MRTSLLGSVAALGVAALIGLTVPGVASADPTAPRSGSPRQSAPAPKPAPVAPKRSAVDGPIVAYRDGVPVVLPKHLTAAGQASFLDGLRAQLTEQGMALYQQLMQFLPMGGGGNGPSRGTPVLTVTPSSIAPGSTVAVSGSGYRPGEDLYVVQTVAKPSSGYPSTYADGGAKLTVRGDGTFAATLKIQRSFNGVDCSATKCFVASITAFPKLTDRTQDAWVPITLAGAGAGAGAEQPDTAPAAQGPAAPAPGAPATGQPAVSLSKSTGLNPAGDTVTVTGRGFGTSGPGVYVGIAQTDQHSSTDASAFGPGTVFVSTANGKLSSDGSFSVQLPVAARFGKADCTKNACAVYTLAAHGSTDRSQDTSTGVSFAGGPSAGADAPAASPAAEPPAAAGTAAVSLSTTSIASTGATPITVSGKGFSTAGPGVYLGVAETARYSTTDASAFGAVTYVRPDQIGADGSFTVTLDVEPVFAAGNCVENPCAIYTMAAHGSADRSQDTATPLTIKGADAGKPAEGKTAEGKTASDKAANAASSPGSASTDPDVQAVAATSTTDDSVSPWIWGAGTAALVVAAALGGLLLGRRTSR
ncbi:neocarzinostatin apoprotein domain-containing protein [Gordonia alkaliphila]|uniref:neocarzinostatin apoprotein domain-containing protein n=1 Tax=Gordonia alkaliphila TaxID=1053547 RepID=UPI001FF61E61|nr:neocarzinostatin apoprotein domain-containing protein [Gordonia alkaliphila]MCK0439537.1 neocarzinostatin apoprotein domain-containing protein [Gordonia alkaliphila]